MTNKPIEIALVCECGNRDSVAMVTSNSSYHPGCSAECGKRMRPASLEEIAPKKEVVGRLGHDGFVYTERGAKTDETEAEFLARGGRIFAFGETTLSAADLRFETLQYTAARAWRKIDVSVYRGEVSPRSEYYEEFRAAIEASGYPLQSVKQARARNSE